MNEEERGFVIFWGYVLIFVAIVAWWNVNTEHNELTDCRAKLAAKE